MSLKIIDDPKAYCTAARQFTYRIAWRPEKHLGAGMQFEIRSHCLRAFLAWRYVQFSLDAGEVTFRWKSRPSVSEVFRNRERVILRARLLQDVVKGDTVEFAMTVIPPVWAGIDNILACHIQWRSACRSRSPSPRNDGKGWSR